MERFQLPTLVAADYLVPPAPWTLDLPPPYFLVQLRPAYRQGPPTEELLTEGLPTGTKYPARRVPVSETELPHCQVHPSGSKCSALQAPLYCQLETPLPLRFLTWALLLRWLLERPRWHRAQC